MIDHDGWVSPTDEEKRILREKIRDSIYDPLIVVMETDDFKISVTAILLALKQARKMEIEANRLFDEANRGKGYGHYADPPAIVASCLLGHILQVSDSEEVHPTNMGGEAIMAFAMAAQILQASSNLSMTLECDELDIGDVDISLKLLSKE